MRATADRFRGRTDEFLAFLRREWGWIIEHDRARGIISIDESKRSCVCPLVPKEHGGGLGVLCHCSEGFAEMMFSAVIGAPARAEVTESILRGHQSCKYRIELETR
jgi:predicted hydrocarbon binding protein